MKTKTSNRNLSIFSDSESAIKALVSPSYNNVQLIWEPGHSNIQGNEKADQLARHGAPQSFIEPEPVLGVPLLRMSG